MIERGLTTREDEMRRNYPSDISRAVVEKKGQAGLEKARKKTKPRAVEL